MNRERGKKRETRPWNESALHATWTEETHGPLLKNTNFDQIIALRGGTEQAVPPRRW